MQHLVIIGGGFAGFWGAMSAVRQARGLGRRKDLKITLIAKDEFHAIRPRFYENDLEGLRVPLRHYLDPLGINLVIAEVQSIAPDSREIHLGGGNEVIGYDCLILGAGSRLALGSIPGIERVFDVDTFEAASRLDRHLRTLSQSGFPTQASRNIVVVGGGLTGLELVTALPGRLKALAPDADNFTVFLSERATTLAAGYSPEGRRYILDQLAAAGVKVLVGDEPARLDSSTVTMKSGATIATETVVWAAGVAASPLTANFNGHRDSFGRLSVDQYLRLPAHGNVFVAGDAAYALADESNYALMSCQHAMPQGKLAGHNAVNLLLGEALVPYSQPRYGTCLDLGGDTALATTGWERSIHLTGPEAKAMKRQIVTQWIYPARSAEEAVVMASPDA